MKGGARESPLWLVSVLDQVIVLVGADDQCDINVGWAGVAPNKLFEEIWVLVG